MFAHDRLLPVFPILPDSSKTPAAVDAKLNQRVAILLLQLDPWLCVDHTARAARKCPQQQQQPQDYSRGASQGSEAAVAHLVHTAVRLRERSMLQEQGGDGGNRKHGCGSSLVRGSQGAPVTLGVQRLLEYAVHVVRAVGAHRNKGRKGRGGDITASDLRTALWVALKLISQVRESLQPSVVALFQRRRQPRILSLCRLERQRRKSCRHRFQRCLHRPQLTQSWLQKHCSWEGCVSVSASGWCKWPLLG